MLTLLLSLYTSFGCKPEDAQAAGSQKFFFLAASDCWPHTSDLSQLDKFLDLFALWLPFPLLASLQASASATRYARRLWTNPCISTGANVQKQRQLWMPKICTPSVQARYRVCSGHRNARKPLSLWRKSRLSTVNGRVYYYYQFVYISFN